MPDKEAGVGRQEVTVTDIRMPFGSMVVFMVKWAIAAIPAVAILLTAAVVITGLLSSLSVVFVGMTNAFSGNSGVVADNSSQSTSFSAASFPTQHDPARAVGTAKIYMNAVDRTIHFPGCDAVSKSSVLGSWSDAGANGYSAHQCRISAK